MSSGIDQAFLRHHPNNFRSGNAEAALGGGFMTGIEGSMERCFLNVCQVHRNLGDAVLFHVPPDRFHMFQHSRNPDRIAFFVDHRIPGRRAIERLDPALFSNIEGDGVRSSHRFGVEIYIVGDQKFPRSNRRCTSLCIKLVRSEIRVPLCLLNFVEESFVFALSNHRKIRPECIFGRFLIEINGDF